MLFVGGYRPQLARLGGEEGKVSGVGQMGPHVQNHYPSVGHPYGIRLDPENAGSVSGPNDVHCIAFRKWKRYQYAGPVLIILTRRTVLSLNTWSF